MNYPTGPTRSSRKNDCLKPQNAPHQRIYGRHELDSLLNALYDLLVPRPADRED
jgi:hypothetical protein